jgi:hypothetical protein
LHGGGIVNSMAKDEEAVMKIFINITFIIELLFGIGFIAMLDIFFDYLVPHSTM